MNLRTIVLPVLAVAGLVATVAAVKKMEFRTLDVPVPVTPAPSPFESRIAATGLVEPLGGVTYVDAADAGVVGRVAVAEGDVERRCAPSGPRMHLETELCQAGLDAFAQSRLV